MKSPQSISPQAVHAREQLRGRAPAKRVRRSTPAVCLAAAILAGYVQTATAQEGQSDEGGTLARWWDDFISDMYVGVQANTSREPYVDEDLDIIAFPRPGRLTDYTFEKDDWLGFRDGVAFIHLLQSSPWEFNIVGRFDSRGYRPDENEGLAGLARRRFSVGAGVGGAWRGERAYVELWGVTDVINRSNGETYSATVGFPMRFQDNRLEFVPHVDLFYDSADTANYYYGVGADETAPGRPAFELDGATTVRLASRINYRTKGCWGFSASFNVDLLAGDVTSSPILARNTDWGTSIAIMCRLRCDPEGRLGGD